MTTRRKEKSTSGGGGVYDAAKYLEELQRGLHEKGIPPSRLRQYEAVALMRDFVSLFSFDDKGAATLHVVPSHKELESIAKAFYLYLTRKALSLDEAFGVKAKGPGRHSAREQLAKRDKAIRGVALYREYLREEQAKSSRVRGEPSPTVRAIERVAKQLDMSFESVKSMLHRRPKEVYRN